MEAEPENRWYSSPWIRWPFHAVMFPIAGTLLMLFIAIGFIVRPFVTHKK